MRLREKILMWSDRTYRPPHNRSPVRQNRAWNFGAWAYAPGNEPAARTTVNLDAGTQSLSKDAWWPGCAIFHLDCLPIPAASLHVHFSLRIWDLRKTSSAMLIAQQRHAANTLLSTLTLKEVFLFGDKSQLRTRTGTCWRSVRLRWRVWWHLKS